LPTQQALVGLQQIPPLQQSAFLVVLFPAFTTLPNAISTVSAVKIIFFISINLNVFKKLITLRS
jgi:hypothetical protein